MVWDPPTPIPLVLSNKGEFYLLVKLTSVNTARWVVLFRTLRVRLPGTPGIQMNVAAIYHNALPPNITPSCSPPTLSTSTLYDCVRSMKFPPFPNFPTNGTIKCTVPL